MLLGRTSQSAGSRYPRDCIGSSSGGHGFRPGPGQAVALIPGRAPSVRAGCCYYDTNPAQSAHPARPPGACRG
jgi:hypothetical protein